MQDVKNGTNRWSGCIILTHTCPNRCKFCCDKLVHTSDRVCTMEEIKRFLELCKLEAEPVKDIFILGGEPVTVNMDYLHEICDEIHSRGYKTVLTTAQIKPDVLLALDGYIDFLNISYYKNTINPSDYGKMKFSTHFKQTDVVWSKLLLRQAFPTFETFEKFLDMALAGNFQFKFSTLNPDSPNLHQDHPTWVDDWAKQQGVIPIFHGKAEGLMYRGSLVKLLHNSKEAPAYLRLHPNGVVNRDWDNEEINLLEN